MAGRLIRTGTPIVWSDSGGDYTLTLSSLANNAARQGQKGDLGLPHGEEYAVFTCIQIPLIPLDGTIVTFSWATSPSGTPGTDNPGGTTGVDSPYPDPDNDLEQLQTIGATICRSVGDDQIQVFRFSPLFRYGMPVVHNQSGQILGVGPGSYIEFHPIIE